MRVELAPALILHRRAYRETSLLVEALTRDHGRIGLVARGARAPKARWRGLLEPLQPVRLSWSGRGELHTLTNAEPGRVDTRLAGENLYAGFYAGELTMRLTARDDPHRALFDAFSGLLEALAEGANPAAPIRQFECELLAAIGYGLPLTQESQAGTPVAANREYIYHPDEGLRAADDVARHGEVRIPGDVLLGLADGTLAGAEQLAAARRLLKTALKPHLGNRPLQTTKTLRAMRRMQDNGQDS